jgi:hypothetical protein
MTSGDVFMNAERVFFRTIEEATAAIDAIGSSNSQMMATRAVYVNVLIRQVPENRARLLKRTYKEVGAEVAISHEAYYETEDVVTDMIVMGSVYQHREVRRILTDNPAMGPLIAEIGAVIETVQQKPD